MSATKPQQSYIVHYSDVPRQNWQGEQRLKQGGVFWSNLATATQTPSAQLTCGMGFLPVGEMGYLSAHRHDPAELYYIVAGSGEIIIDGQKSTVKPGDTVFLAANCEHELINTGNEELQFFYVFPTDTFEEIDYRFS